MSKKDLGTVLVTGGARRIGRAIALFLAQQGYKVALHYSASEADALRTAKAIRIFKQRCELFRCDLFDAKQTLDLLPAVVKRFPDLKLLVNNAAIFETSDMRGHVLASWQRHFAINQRAPYLLTSAFSKYCKTGQVINILDSRIARNDTQYFAYSLSKKSLTAMTEMAALDLAPRIRVNGIAPGIILPPAGKKRDYLQRLLKNVPLRRAGRIADILAAIKYLIGNSYVTGQVLFIDGGQHLLGVVRG